MNLSYPNIYIFDTLIDFENDKTINLVIKLPLLNCTLIIINDTGNKFLFYNNEWHEYYINVCQSLDKINSPKINKFYYSKSLDKTYFFDGLIFYEICVFKKTITDPIVITGPTGSSGQTGTSGTSGTSSTTNIINENYNCSNCTSGTSGSSGYGSSFNSTNNGTSGTSGTSCTSCGTCASCTSGTSGTSGTAGSSGQSGTSGTSGTAGSSGQSGTSGTSGTNGGIGLPGTSGTSGTSTTRIFIEFNGTDSILDAYYINAYQESIVRVDATTAAGKTYYTPFENVEAVTLTGGSNATNSTNYTLKQYSNIFNPKQTSTIENDIELSVFGSGTSRTSGTGSLEISFINPIRLASEKDVKLIYQIAPTGTSSTNGTYKFEMVSGTSNANRTSGVWVNVSSNNGTTWSAISSNSGTNSTVTNIQFNFDKNKIDSLADNIRIKAIDIGQTFNATDAYCITKAQKVKSLAPIIEYNDNCIITNNQVVYKNNTLYIAKDIIENSTSSDGAGNPINNYRYNKIVEAGDIIEDVTPTISQCGNINIDIVTTNNGTKSGSVNLTADAILNVLYTAGYISNNTRVAWTALPWIQGAC